MSLLPRLLPELRSSDLWGNRLLIKEANAGMKPHAVTLVENKNVVQSNRFDPFFNAQILSVKKY